MQNEMLIYLWRSSLLIIQQSDPEGAIDTVLGRLALCSIMITFSLLAGMLVFHRRRVRWSHEHREGIARTADTAPKPPTGE